MNGWKATAIIFMILFVLIVGFMVWAYTLAVEDVDRENECLYNVCSEEPYYIYYEFEKVCECYDDNYELTKEAYIK